MCGRAWVYHSVRHPFASLLLFLAALVALSGAVSPALAVNVIPNGTFAGNIDDWTENTIQNDGSLTYDSVVGGAAAGSMRFWTDARRNGVYQAEATVNLLQDINDTDTVWLRFYWYKNASVVPASGSDVAVYAVPPSGGDILLWSNTAAPAANTPLTGNENINVSDLLTATGTYQIKVSATLNNGSNKNSRHQFNLDDIVLDVAPGVVNSAPTVVAGATAASLSPVNRFGAGTTVLSTVFSDTDSPGVGAFTVTLKVREPDNSTEVVLVNGLTTGNGGLTVTDQGGGNYTASYTWDPGAGQVLGLYDLYCEISDGVDAVIDGYANNDNELEVNEVIANSPPAITAGATASSVNPVNRFGAATTVLSTVFSDADSPGVGAFTVTLKVREPDNSTEVVLVNGLTTGNGGLTVTDQGGGNYTASYTWDPGAGQALGLYDLYCEISDAEDVATDTYANNDNELEVVEVPPNNPPVIAVGATGVSVTPVNRFGSETTTLSAAFSDTDIARVRRPSR